jgi:putative ABC transport system substrate-binding protein
MATRSERATGRNPVRIGFLPLGSPSDTYDQSLVEAFRDGLRKIGVVENRHVVLDFAWVRSESELPGAVTELVQRGAKLLITRGTSASVAAKRQVSTIPILFITVGNPLGVGLVDSLSRPGGNATGFSDMHADLGGKYVEFAIELAGKPQMPVDYLWYSEWADGRHRLEVTERAAKLLGVQLRTRAIPTSLKRMMRSLRSRRVTRSRSSFSPAHFHTDTESSSSVPLWIMAWGRSTLIHRLQGTAH